MKRCPATLLLVIVSASSQVFLLGQTAVVTRAYNNSRTGANTNETKLKPENVGNLKLLRTLKLDNGDDPRIEAQPLYVPRLNIDGQQRDIVFVATMADRVYAFDANTGKKLWKQKLGTPITPQEQGPTGFGQTKTEIDLYGINKRWGVLSTPVIDGNTLYVVSWTSNDKSRDNAIHQLHALDIRTGNKVHDPVRISADLGGGVRFNPPQQKQRSALTLATIPGEGGGPSQKVLLIASGMHGENGDGKHGWVLAYDPQTLERKGAWCSTRQSKGGGIWQAGQGISVDDQGRIFALTSNGGWNGTTDFAESFVRLRFRPEGGGNPASLDVEDWFTPFRDNERAENGPNGYDFRDQDLGSAAAILPPNTNLVIGAGKDGILYVFDRGNLGKKRVDPQHTGMAENAPLLNAIFFTYFPGDLNPLNITDSFPADGKTHHLHGAPVAWASDSHGTMLFVYGENAPLRAWSIKSTGEVPFLAESQETASAFSGRFDAMPGGMLTLSADGGHNGIVWSTVPIKGNWQGRQNEGDANKEIVEGVLRAYDAVDFQDAQPNKHLKLLWQSSVPGQPLQPGQTRFTFNKFTPPVVADGRVLVPTYDGTVLIFGL